MGTIIIALILALAPCIGYLVGMLAKEEIAQGKKYFAITQCILFISIMSVFLFVHKWELWFVVIGLTVLFGYLLFKPFRNIFFVQLILGIIFSSSATAFLISSLIFLHGLPTGSLEVQHKKGLRNVIIAGILFFATTNAAQYII